MVTVLAVSAAAVAGASTQVAAQSQCTNYTVVRGDTLFEIAQTAALSGGFQEIYNANRDILPSPNVLEVGQVLRIPCDDGNLPVASNAAPARVATLTAAEATQRPVRFLTGGNYAPFTDENLPGQGMFTQLVTRSMELGNAEQDFEVIFVNDWGAHLSVLLPSGAFDMGFPWFLPDCSQVGNLSPSNAMRCTEFDASEPFYDALVGYYTLQGSEYAQADEYSDLYGARLCRPDGWFSFDLEAEGLTDPNVELIFAASEEACWEMLTSNAVDVVTYDALPAEKDFADLGLQEQVVQLTPLASKQTLHVFVPKSHPNGQAYLQTLNAGLEQLRLSGEWFSLVRSGIQASAEN
ncbi:LysM peptidoglycan-binding domain-containing protein [Loktanella agnita]